MFGKILVFLTLGLSLVSLTWAFSLWEHPTVKPDKNDGSLGELDTLRKSLAADYALAFTRSPQESPAISAVLNPMTPYWDRALAREKLEFAEYYLPLERKWYNDELNFLMDGQYRGVAGREIKQLKFDAITGAPLSRMGPAGEFLEMEPIKDNMGKEIKPKPLKKYWEEYELKVKQAGDEAARLKRAADVDRKATVLLTGERDPKEPLKLVGPPGLQARIETEILKHKAIDRERVELRPLWLNAKVELLNLEELRQCLEDRIKELDEAKRKRDAVPTP